MWIMISLEVIFLLHNVEKHLISMLSSIWDSGWGILIICTVAAANWNGETDDRLIFGGEEDEVELDGRDSGCSFSAIDDWDGS